MIDIEDIKGSIQNSKLIFLPYEVKYCFDDRGRIIFYSGGYAVLFPCCIDGKKKAVRCWHTPISDLNERYRNIAKDFTDFGVSFLVPFEYILNSLKINGRDYPYMITDWVDGQNIKDYVWENRRSKEKLLTLARRFLVLCAEMDGRKISHGDLQHGNILVGKDGRIFLIDYDSVWTSGMGSSCPDIIKGLAAYQHPRRKDNLYGFTGRDRFSQLVIYLSIVAVIHNPFLAEKYHFADSEHMLFSAEDFACWRYSEVRKDLCQIKDEEIDHLVIIMDCYLEHDNITSLPSFYLF